MKKLLLCTHVFLTGSTRTVIRTAKIIFSILFLIVLISCGKKAEKHESVKTYKYFDLGSLRSDIIPLKQLKGQLLYLPIYSNIPYQIDTVLFDMSAFVAIHNTDLSKELLLTKVLYFNQDGKLVDDFLKNGNIKIEPLATKNFYIPYEDKSGTGANFLIEWVSDSIVNEPLIEAVTLCLKPNNTLAILSQGKIISEKK